MWIADGWKDFEVLDASGGEKLERWGKYTFVRPDPQVIWNTERLHPAWNDPSASYSRSSTGGGHWNGAEIPVFRIGYKDLTFQIKPMSFKHTGVFPEQAANWDFIRQQIKQAGRPVSVLNLFAYTGGATLAAASAGATVCHVDAARGMVTWAKENAKCSGLENAPIRYIVDDCKKFIKREITRGRKYDAIIMDPPSYGRGPSGEIWRFEENIGELVDLAVQLLSDDPLFIIINSYTAGISPSVPAYILGTTAAKRFGGTVEAQELGLPVESTGLALPCGHTSRWIRKK
jgi:23S rRNA (cytosine1962-C5)-methyltransferase